MPSKGSDHAVAMTQDTETNNVFLFTFLAKLRCQSSGKRSFIETSVDTVFHLQEAFFFSKYPPYFHIFQSSVFGNINCVCCSPRVYWTEADKLVFFSVIALAVHSEIWTTLRATLNSLILSLLNWRITNQLDATYYFIVFLIDSTYFGHYYTRKMLSL